MDLCRLGDTQAAAALPLALLQMKDRLAQVRAAKSLFFFSFWSCGGCWSVQARRTAHL